MPFPFLNFKRNMDKLVQLYPFTPFPAEQFTHQAQILDTGGVWTMVVPEFTAEVLVQAIDQSIRYTLDGTDPTAGGLGFVLTAGNDPIAIPYIDGWTVLKFLAVANNAILQWHPGR